MVAGSFGDGHIDLIVADREGSAEDPDHDLTVFQANGAAAFNLSGTLETPGPMHRGSSRATSRATACSTWRLPTKPRIMFMVCSAYPCPLWKDLALYPNLRQVQLVGPPRLSFSPFVPIGRMTKVLAMSAIATFLALAGSISNTRHHWDFRPLVGLCVRLQLMDPIGYKKPRAGPRRPLTKLGQAHTLS